jgi:thiol:disulfide interchange protein
VPALLLVLAGVLVPSRATAGADWNDQQVHWLSYEKGLAAARQHHKPICMVLYAEWCPHCRNYSQIFKDPKVIEKSSQFVMIRLDVDTDKALADRFNVDGTYVPRTYFMSPDGTIQQDVHASRGRFIYFYDEADPASVLSGMDEALKKQAH